MKAYSVASANKLSHVDRHHLARGHAARRWDHVGLRWCGYLVDEVVQERVAVVLEGGELGVDLMRGHGRPGILMGWRRCDGVRLGEDEGSWRWFGGNLLSWSGTGRGQPGGFKQTSVEAPPTRFD